MIKHACIIVSIFSGKTWIFTNPNESNGWKVSLRFTTFKLILAGRNMVAQHQTVPFFNTWVGLVSFSLVGSVWGIVSWRRNLRTGSTNWCFCRLLSLFYEGCFLMFSGLQVSFSEVLLVERPQNAILLHSGMNYWRNSDHMDRAKGVCHFRDVGQPRKPCYSL